MCVWTGKKRTNTTNREATNKSKEKVVDCVRGARACVCVLEKGSPTFEPSFGGRREKKKKRKRRKKTNK